MNDRHTEKELFILQKQNLFILDKSIQNGSILFNNVQNFMPDNIHLNSRTDLSIKYINNSFEKTIDTTIKEIVIEGVDFIKRFAHPNTTKKVVPVIKRFIQKGDQHQVLNYFQYSKPNLSSDYTWALTSKKIFKAKPDLMIAISNPMLILENIIHKTNRILEENLFIRNNFEKFELLTKQEKEILKLIAEGKTNQEIGDNLFISKLTVKTHRQHIIQKLETKRIADFVRYTVAFGLTDRTF